MSADEGALLGRVVFGTGRGLFASGTGLLAGAADSLQTFELRSGDPDRALVPAAEMPMLMRRALVRHDNSQLDLIAVVTGIIDGERRPGFLGYGFAVPYGDRQGYATALDALTEEFPPVLRHYVREDRFRDNVRDFFAEHRPDLLGGPPVGFAEIGRRQPPIVGVLPAWWDHVPLVDDFLDAAVSLSAEDAATIVVAAAERSGGWPITPDAVASLRAEAIERAGTRERLEADRSSARAEIHAREDLEARREIRKLSARLDQANRKIATLEQEIRRLAQRQGASPRATALDLSAPPPRAFPLPGSPLVWAAGATCLVTLILLAALAWWTLGKDEAPAAPAPAPAPPPAATTTAPTPPEAAPEAAGAGAAPEPEAESGPGSTDGN